MSSPTHFLLSPPFGYRCHFCSVFTVCVQYMSNVLKLRPLEGNLPPGTQTLITHKWFRTQHYLRKNLFAACPGMFARTLWLSWPALVSHLRSYLITLSWLVWVSMFIAARLWTPEGLIRRSLTRSGNLLFTEASAGDCYSPRVGHHCSYRVHFQVFH